MKKHANLSIFVPHAGCPHLCSFCNQREISGTDAPPDADYVRELCEKYLPQDGADTEIAFFGGSFTAIERGYMLSLLGAAKPFTDSGRAAGIRVSTRPDAIDPERLDILKSYGVTAIELGAQSMDDRVLRLNGRGHTAAQVEDAARLIKQRGFSLGLQMMPGLYGERDYALSALSTAQRLAALSPDTMRIYPTIVVENTLLCDYYRAGRYEPLTLAQAVDITAGLLLYFDKLNIKVIRVGLHDDVSLRCAAVAGPFHSAFGELAYGEAFRRVIDKALLEQRPGRVEICVPQGSLSKAAGQNKRNLNYFADMGYNIKITETPALCGFQILVQTGDKRCDLNT